VSVLGVREVQWKGQGEIRSGDYTEDFQGNRIVEQSQVLKIWENYTAELYDQPN